MKAWIGAIALVCLGCLQMVGDVAGFPLIRALGAASQASPAPKVFTSQAGFETFSSRFFIDWRDRDGAWHVVELTPQAYRRIAGPYNRRNAYGAALSYAPVLSSNPRTRRMLDEVTQFGFCADAPLLRELAIPKDEIQYPLWVRLAPRDSVSATGPWQTAFRIDCTSMGS